MVDNVLKNKNYLLLFLGSVVSNLGSHVFNFAISYYIYEIATPTIAGIYCIFIKIPNEDKILIEILSLETVVQIIEFT